MDPPCLEPVCKATLNLPETLTENGQQSLLAVCGHPVKTDTTTMRETRRTVPFTRARTPWSMARSARRECESIFTQKV